jgi:hypothetical protein
MHFRIDPVPFSFHLSCKRYNLSCRDRPSEHNGSLLKDMFLMEKILGAVFSVLFFLTISKILVRV